MSATAAAVARHSAASLPMIRRALGVSGGQLGNLEAGALGSLTSPVISALAGGLITVAGAIAIGLALPGFTRYRSEAAAGQDEPESGTTTRTSQRQPGQARSLASGVTKQQPRASASTNRQRHTG